MDRYFRKETPERYYFLDAIRGVCVLGMVLYHTLFDVYLLGGFSVGAPYLLLLNAIRDVGASFFIFISGFCFHLGSHRLRRFVVLLISGAVVSGITFIVVPETAVSFGILSFMAASGALMCLLNRPFQKLPAIPAFFISLSFFVILFHINFGYLGFGSFIIVELPRFLYRNNFTAFFGFPFIGFSSGDYYPILPWIWVYFGGYFSFPILMKNKKIQSVLRYKIKFLSLTGKYSLPVYLLHQPLIFAIVWFIFNVIE